MDKILVSPSSFSSCKVLEEIGFEVIVNPFGRKLTEVETIVLGKSCIGIIAGVESYTKELLSHFDCLKCISRCGVGIDSIDIDASKELGIIVKSTKSPKRAVAELTIGLILCLIRNINTHNLDIKRGFWAKKTGRLLTECRIGVVGLGNVGRTVYWLLTIIGVNDVVGYDIVDAKSSIEQVSMDELLSSCDVITLHVSSSDCIIGEKELSLMKDGSYLVNTSRGEVVDEDALYEALVTKRLAGAALDVFCEEPYSGSLKELDNVILTPHIGSYAKETRNEMERQAVENLLEGLEWK